MINKIFALPVIEQLTPVLSRRQLDELEVLVVDHPRLKRLSRYRAHIFFPGNQTAKRKSCG